MLTLPFYGSIVTILRIDCYYFTDGLLLFYGWIVTILRMDCYYFTDGLLLFYGSIITFLRIDKTSLKLFYSIVIFCVNFSPKSLFPLSNNVS